MLSKITSVRLYIFIFLSLFIILYNGNRKSEVLSSDLSRFPSYRFKSLPTSSVPLAQISSEFMPLDYPPSYATAVIDLTDYSDPTVEQLLNLIVQQTGLNLRVTRVKNRSFEPLNPKFSGYVYELQIKEYGQYFTSNSRVTQTLSDYMISLNLKMQSDDIYLTLVKDPSSVKHRFIAVTEAEILEVQAKRIIRRIPKPINNSLEVNFQKQYIRSLEPESHNEFIFFPHVSSQETIIQFLKALRALWGTSIKQPSDSLVYTSVDIN